PLRVPARDRTLRAEFENTAPRAEGFVAIQVFNVVSHEEMMHHQSWKSCWLPLQREIQLEVLDVGTSTGHALVQLVQLRHERLELIGDPPTKMRIPTEHHRISEMGDEWTSRLFAVGPLITRTRPEPHDLSAAQLRRERRGEDAGRLRA